MKKFFFVIVCQFFSFFVCIASQDIETSNAGEKAMISILRSSIDANKALKDKNIIIGAGESGCEAFKEKKAETQVLLVWQWLDDLRGVTRNTWVVVPEHALDNRFAGLNIIPIEGVLHSKKKQDFDDVDAAAIPDGTQMIVMLAGDTQHEDGSWKIYTTDALIGFVKLLPIEQKILLLNGPRTGKFLPSIGDKLAEDKAAHRDGIDHVTKALEQFKCGNENWQVRDFKYGQKSLWPSAIKYCMENPKTVLIMAAESTSMISELLSLGIKPVFYQHDAMTETSKRYVKILVRKNQAIQFPELTASNQLSAAIPLQQDIVIKKLEEIVQYERAA